MSQGGTAPDAEATDPGVAWRGAHAALTSRNQPARAFFTQLLPDGPYRRELQARGGEARGRPAAERITAWTQLLGEAVDDTMAAKCIAALARLGVWPPQADELRARSVLPADHYDTLQAVYHARSGEPGIGIARLRELADTTMLAALQLIQLLEEYAGSSAWCSAAPPASAPSATSRSSSSLCSPATTPTSNRPSACSGNSPSTRPPDWSPARNMSWRPWPRNSDSDLSPTLNASVH